MNRALVVGVNQHGLKGCVNDAKNIANLLVSRFAFSSANIRLLTDARGTKSAILDRLNWLVANSSQSDRLVFYYSGHGGQSARRDDKGLLTEGYDFLCPSDFDWSNENNGITSNDLTAIFSGLNRGAKLWWISDSCNSGGLLPHLPRNKSSRPPVRQLNPPADIAWRLKAAKDAKLPIRHLSEAASKPGIVLLAACRSDEEASDLPPPPNQHDGAFTYYLVNALKNVQNSKMPLVKITASLRKTLARRSIVQTPQLEGDTIMFEKPFLSP